MVPAFVPRWCRAYPRAAVVSNIVVSDQMQWPDTIGIAIEVIESVKFLTEEQRRDIFYNNAARFLRVAASDGRDGPRPPRPPLETTAPGN